MPKRGLGAAGLVTVHQLLTPPELDDFMVVNRGVGGSGLVEEPQGPAPWVTAVAAVAAAGPVRRRGRPTPVRWSRAAWEAVVKKLRIQLNLSSVWV